VRLTFRKLPKPVLAALLIVVGILGRLALARSANIEPVLVLSMLAGALLGGIYVFLVPVAIMAVTDAFLYTYVYADAYSPVAVLGLGVFVYTGFVFVAFLGGFAMRRRLVWRTRTIAIFTAISVPLTVAYDVWTAFGDWLFLASGFGRTLPEVYAMQVPFTLIHIFSSLLFAPILGTTFLAIHLHGLPLVESAPAEADAPEK
jgi:hypothetical protein